MAHNLAIQDDKAEMFYVGERPWHGLGTELDHPATAAEAIEAAGLNWQVVPRELVTKAGDKVDNHRAIIRLDTHACLGVVGPGYIPIQNREAFAFFDTVVGGGRAHYHTAGALGSGERIWMLARLPGDVVIDGTDDVTEKFLLLSNSHDGSSSLRMFFTPVRVVCQNTLNVALNGSAQQGISIRHTGDIATKVSESQRALGLAVRYYDDLEDMVNRLARIPLRQRDLGEYFLRVMPDREESESHTRTENIRHAMLRNFEDGRGNDLPGIRGTLWAAVNAVTEFIDHQRSTRGTRDVERRSNRLASQWFGSGARLKARAWEEALAVAANN